MLIFVTAALMGGAAALGQNEAENKENYKPELLPSLNTVAAALLTCTIFDEDGFDHFMKLFSRTDNLQGKGGRLSHIGVAVLILGILIGSSAASPKGGVSFGLIVAVALNFAMDGLMVNGELINCKGKGVKGLGLEKVIGFLADNIVLMLILGFQFQKANMSKGNFAGYTVGILLLFVASMLIGVNLKDGGEKQSFASKLKNYTPTITAVVILYTIFCELMPESNTFEDFDGEAITPEESESSYIRNYGNLIQPILFFGTFVAYMIYGALAD